MSFDCPYCGEHVYRQWLNGNMAGGLTACEHCKRDIAWNGEEQRWEKYDLGEKLMEQALKGKISWEQANEEWVKSWRELTP